MDSATRMAVVVVLRNPEYTQIAGHPVFATVVVPRDDAPRHAALVRDIFTAGGDTTEKLKAAGYFPLPHLTETQGDVVPDPPRRRPTPGELRALAESTSLHAPELFGVPRPVRVTTVKPHPLSEQMNVPRDVSEGVHPVKEPAAIRTVTPGLLAGILDVLGDWELMTPESGAAAVVETVPVAKAREAVDRFLRINPDMPVTPERVDVVLWSAYTAQRPVEFAGGPHGPVRLTPPSDKQAPRPFQTLESITDPAVLEAIERAYGGG